MPYEMPYDMGLGMPGMLIPRRMQDEIEALASPPAAATRPPELPIGPSGPGPGALYQRMQQAKTNDLALKRFLEAQAAGAAQTPGPPAPTPEPKFRYNPSTGQAVLDFPRSMSRPAAVAAGMAISEIRPGVPQINAGQSVPPGVRGLMDEAGLNVPPRPADPYGPELQGMINAAPSDYDRQKIIDRVRDTSQYMGSQMQGLPPRPTLEDLRAAAAKGAPLIPITGKNFTVYNPEIGNFQFVDPSGNPRGRERWKAENVELPEALKGTPEGQLFQQVEAARRRTEPDPSIPRVIARRGNLVTMDAMGPGRSRGELGQQERQRRSDANALLGALVGNKDRVLQDLQIKSGDYARALSQQRIEAILADPEIPDAQKPAAIQAIRNIPPEQINPRVPGATQVGQPGSSPGLFETPKFKAAGAIESLKSQGGPWGQLAQSLMSDRGVEENPKRALDKMLQTAGFEADPVRGIDLVRSGPAQQFLKELVGPQEAEKVTDDVLTNMVQNIGLREGRSVASTPRKINPRARTILEQVKSGKVSAETAVQEIRKIYDEDTKAWRDQMTREPPLFYLGM